MLMQSPLLKKFRMNILINKLNLIVLLSLMKVSTHQSVTVIKVMHKSEAVYSLCKTLKKNMFYIFNILH